MLSHIRIGSRRSDLARLQAKLVGAQLGTETFVFKEAPGDVNLVSPLWKMPEMGIFTSFLRKYLVSEEIDLVVHSWKDLPIDTEGLTEIVGSMEREDERDLFLVNKEALLEAYETGTLIVLSSSPRRKHNLPEFLLKSIPPLGLKKIENIQFKDVRGNIQTRLGKMGPISRSEGHSLIVAKAAIDRFLLAGKTMPEFKETADLVHSCLSKSYWQVLPLSVNPTAAAQGALAVEMSSSPSQAANRLAVKSLLPASTACVEEERKNLHALGGGCHQKIGCTVLDRKFGRVTFLRGQTDASNGPTFVRTIKGNVSIKDSAANVKSLLFGGKGGVQLFDRELIPEARAKVLAALAANPEAGIFVAKSDAVASFSPSDFFGRPIWTSGVQSMLALTSRGFWVHGTCDSLGEDEEKRVELMDKHKGWIKVTHDYMPSTECPTIGTYRLVLKNTVTRESLLTELQGKKYIFFSSGSAFTAVTGLVPELVNQFQQGTCTVGCGPGNTLALISMHVDLKQIRVAYNFEDFIGKDEIV